jgi:BNR repeat-containing family member
VSRSHLALGAAMLAAVAGSAALSEAGAADRSAEKPPTSGPRLLKASRTFGSGGWSWFADPRAVWVDGHVVAAWVDQDRYVVVASIRDQSVYRVRIAREHIDDDHGNPALLVRPDGRITAYYSDHNGSSMRFRTTSHPGDIGQWGSEHKLPDNTSGSQGFTYPNPAYLSDEDRTYLFWRGADWSLAYARTGSSGFSNAHAMFARHGARPYTKVATNGRDEIYLAFTNGHPEEVRTSIFFATYRHGELFRASGKRIGSIYNLPLRPGKADHVYVANQHGGVRSWVHDVAMGVDGKPVVVYATFRDGGRRHRYEYARWNGAHWRLHKLVDAGGPILSNRRERYYSGGVVLDHDDPRIAYASVEVGGHHEIGRYVTKDGGKSWTRKWITRDSSTDNFRPVVPRNLPAGKRFVLWMRGHYVFYTDFRTSVVGSGRRR